ncbi:MAG: dockerin type I domain-containing protein, partial [Prevotella sp.]
YYDEDASDLEAWLDYVNRDIEAKFAENTLTFYKANLLKDFERILNNSEDLLTGSGNLQANYDKYVNNEKQHTAMLNKVASIVETYNAVKELVYALEFDYEVASNDTYVDGTPKMISWKDKQTLEVIDPLLKALNTKIANDYANIAINNAAKNGITSTSNYNTDVNNINNKIKTFEKEGKYFEANYTYLGNLHETLSDIASRINTKRYTTTTRRALVNRRAELLEAYNNAWTYNNDAYYSGKLIWDIDGNQLATNINDNPDGNPIWSNKVSIDYSSKAWYVLQAKVAELQELADQLYQDADDMSYKLGDVDHDGKITVVDYARVRNMILCAVGYDDIEEEAVKFAADANEDKLIDVADLSAISTIIFGPNATSSRAALFASDFSVENKITADVESEETTIFGKTVRVAVNVE